MTEQEFEPGSGWQQTLRVSTCLEWSLTTKPNQLKRKLLDCIFLESSVRITQSMPKKIEKLENFTGYFGWSLRKCPTCTCSLHLSCVFGSLRTWGSKPSGTDGQQGLRQGVWSALPWPCCEASLFMSNMGCDSPMGLRVSAWGPDMKTWICSLPIGTKIRLNLMEGSLLPTVGLFVHICSVTKRLDCRELLSVTLPPASCYIRETLPEKD